MTDTQTLTKDTKWWVGMDVGHPVVVFSQEHDARDLTAEEGYSGPVVPVRPVLPDDVSEYRRGIEAVKAVVRAEDMWDGRHDGLSANLIARIDKLLAEAPELKGNRTWERD